MKHIAIITSAGATIGGLFVWGGSVLLAVFWLFVQCIEKLLGQHISRSKDGYIDPQAKRT